MANGFGHIWSFSAADRILAPIILKITTVLADQINLNDLSSPSIVACQPPRRQRCISKLHGFRTTDKWPWNEENLVQQASGVAFAKGFIYCLYGLGAVQRKQKQRKKVSNLRKTYTVMKSKTSRTQGAGTKEWKRFRGGCTSKQRMVERFGKRNSFLGVVVIPANVLANEVNSWEIS